jgi:nucleoside-diphosphate-sugar epimerase
VVHLAQFVGDVLVLFGFVALYRSITQGASAGADAPAYMEIVVAAVAEGVYAVNQAVDRIANKSVAEEPFVVDHLKFEQAFGKHATLLKEAIGDTEQWYRSKHPAGDVHLTA